MNGGNNSLAGQLTHKRRKRNLRKCASFERGKCAECGKPETDDGECDMRKAGSKKADAKATD